MFINNEWVSSKTGKKMSVVNPATGGKITEVDEAFKEDVDAAVAAAKNAFELGSEWRKMDASARGKLLWKLSDVLERDMHYVASLETLDNGKPVNNALGDIQAVVATLRYFAGWADKTHGKTIPADGPVFSFTREEPVGVCGLITPWNFPLLIIGNKVAPALAAGNTVVLKTSEKTPLTGLYFASLVKEVGFPPGVFNVLSGFGPSAGAPLAAHMDVELISFTGSTGVGKLVQKTAGESNAKRVLLEMGGKSPLVICDDANLDLAVKIAHEGVMVNMGQCCCAATRTFVQEGIYDEFVKKSAELASKLKPADPFENNCQHGPQVDDIQFNKILDYIEKGKKEGAKLEVGGKRWGSNGYFIEPTVFSNVTDDMTICREEIFGPVQSIIKFKTLDEAIRRSNETHYGLAAGIVTTNVDTALVYSQAVRAGSVWINTWMHITPQTPFGGYKMSGQGREYGEEAIKDYLETKTVTIAVNPPK